MFKLMKRRLVGLEVDSGELRAVELSGKAKSPTLESWGREVLPDGAVEDGIVYSPQQVGEALQELWSRHKFRGSEVILGISNQEVLVRFANFPKVPEDKLGGLIRHQAGEYLPIPLPSVILDYTVIGETTGEEGDMYEVILVAAKNEMLYSFLQTLSFAGLKAWDIDVSSLVLLKVVPGLPREGAVIVVDIANGQTNILLVEGEVPRLARRIPVRLKDVANIMEASESELPSLGDLSQSPPENFLRWADTLVGEIRSSMNYYQAQEGAKPVEEIILSGKGARIPKLLERTEEILNTPVKKMRPGEGINNFQLPGGQELELDYTIALSLALRGLEG